MDAYLQEIKTISTNLASINCPIPQSNLVHYMLLGLGLGYEVLFTTRLYSSLLMIFSSATNSQTTSATA